MTVDQFNALATLLKMQPTSKSRAAAQLIFVEGLTPAEAARRADTTPQAVNSALRSCERGIALARAAVGA